MISDAIVVLLEISGNATPGRDYRRINNFVSFAPGVTETINLTVRPDPGYSLGRPASAQVRLVSGTLDFAQWKAAKFPGNTVPAAVFANLDSDGDHLVNAVEYGFGLDPTVANPNPPGLPRPVVVNGHLGVTFTRPINAVDLDYLIEVSSDLIHWELADDFEEQPGVLGANGIETVTFRDPFPTTLSRNRYVRVSVVLY